MPTIPIYSSKALNYTIHVPNTNSHGQSQTLTSSSWYTWTPSSLTLFFCIIFYLFIIYAHVSVIKQSPSSLASISTPTFLAPIINIQYDNSATNTLPIEGHNNMQLMSACDPQMTELDNPVDSFDSNTANTDLQCKFNWKHPPLLYSYTAIVVEDEDGKGPGLRITIQLRDKCCHLNPANPSPRAYFRVYAVGAAITAIDSHIYLQPNQPHVTTFLRLPDPSTYTLNVRLMLFNFTDHMISDTVSSYYIFPPETPGAFFDQPILDHMTYLPNITYDIPSSKHAPPRLTYEQIFTYKPGTPFISADSGEKVSLPPCGADRSVNGSLTGRLLLGPKRAQKVTRQWESDNIFDEYEAVWAPYDCAIDYTLNMLDELKEIRWLNFIGDSNARHLFSAMCEMTHSTHYAAPKEIRSLDPPQLCVVNSNDKTFVLTYSNWFYGKTWPLNHTLSFREQCSMYDNDPKKYGRFVGWPNCNLVPQEIQDMKYPGLTYLSWGSHQAERGMSEQTLNIFLNEVHGNEYFKHAPALFAFTTAVDGTLIPPKFGRQQLYRNNERISAVNDLQVEAVKRLMSSYPIYSTTDDNEASKPFFPILDVFSFTHSSNERHHGDAVHFWMEIQIVISKLLTHWIHYAPQLHRENVRLDTTVQTS
jgi:hypothetical protein